MQESSKTSFLISGQINFPYYFILAALSVSIHYKAGQKDAYPFLQNEKAEELALIEACTEKCGCRCNGKY